MNRKPSAVGQRFGKIYVVREIPRNSNNELMYECLCDCGTIKNMRHHNVVCGRVKSCGCSRGESNTKDITGQKFGKLKVISIGPKNNKENGSVWQCECDCGGIKFVNARDLRNGAVSSCGCLRSEFQIIDLIGKEFGYLKVIESYELTKNQGMKWRCLCICGNYINVLSSKLKNGHTKSCGCMKNNMIANAKTTHGNSYHPLFGLWKSMIDRCYNSKSKTNQYKRYGGRGIKVCDRWLESFENFYEDMGDRPGPEYSIDRKNNDGDYCKENCRWATREEQANNTSRNNILEYNGESLNISQWSKKTGIKANTIRSRLKAGWDIEKILTTNVSRKKEEKDGE